MERVLRPTFGFFFPILDYYFEIIFSLIDLDYNNEPFIPPSERDDAPLAGILQNPELDKIDPR